MRPLLRRPAVITALAFVMSAAAGCGNPVDRGDPNACQQTYEFGNTGCVEVEGDVVGTAGQALGGIFVVPRFLPGREHFNSPYEVTDLAGRFRLRFTRFGARPLGQSGPDTVSVFIRAADPRSAGVGVPATLRDSVLTVVTITPVGAVPDPVVVRITLPTP